MANLPQKLYVYQNIAAEGPNTSIVFEANIVDALNLQMSWEWSGIVDAKFMQGLQKGAAALRELGSDSPLVSKWTSQIPQNISAGSSLTKSIGGYPDYLRPAVTCRLYIKNSIKDIYEALTKLHNLATPKLGKNLASFENKIVTVFMGDYFILEKACIVSVAETFSKTFIMGHPAWCDVAISFQSVEVAHEEVLKNVFTQIRVLPPK